MNKMLVAVFDTEPAAYEGLNALKELHADGDITLYATAVLVKDSSGAVSVKQTADQVTPADGRVFSMIVRRSEGSSK